jgi:predicted phosphodiesterase
MNTHLLGILSDPHANVSALRAVLADLRGRGIRETICLGDLVGYCAQPREVLALLRDEGVPCVRGNHDLMALDLVDPAHCNPLGRRAIEWTRQVLSPDDNAFLASLPDTLRPRPHIIATHSAPGDVVVRLRHAEQFRAEREAMRRLTPEARICLTGHTHYQEVWTVTNSGAVSRRRGPTVPLDPAAFHFVNPGSVGWPRDGDARAAYAVLDMKESRVLFYRVPCDTAEINRANQRAGLDPLPGGLEPAWTRLASRVRQVLR